MKVDGIQAKGKQKGKGKGKTKDRDGQKGKSKESRKAKTSRREKESSRKGRKVAAMGQMEREKVSPNNVIYLTKPGILLVTVGILVRFEIWLLTCRRDQQLKILQFPPLEACRVRPTSKEPFWLKMAQASRIDGRIKASCGVLRAFVEVSRSNR